MGCEGASLDIWALRPLASQTLRGGPFPVSSRPPTCRVWTLGPREPTPPSCLTWGHLSLGGSQVLPKCTEYNQDHVC